MYSKLLELCNTKILNVDTKSIVNMKKDKHQMNWLAWRVESFFRKTEIKKKKKSERHQLHSDWNKTIWETLPHPMTKYWLKEEKKQQKKPNTIFLIWIISNNSLF